MQDNKRKDQIQLLLGHLQVGLVKAIFQLQSDSEQLNIIKILPQLQLVTMQEVQVKLEIVLRLDLRQEAATKEEMGLLLDHTLEEYHNKVLLSRLVFLQDRQIKAHRVLPLAKVPVNFFKDKMQLQ